MTPEYIRAHVSAIPDFWVGFLAALPNDLLPHPHPVKSFLHEGPPYGWSWGTDTWNMTLLPTSEVGTWVVLYSDDDGHTDVLTEDTISERWQKCSQQRV